MVHGCGNRTVKFLFFTANLLICLFGGIIFGFSLWANLDKDFAAKLEEARQIHKEDFNVLAKYQASLWILVIVGAFLFLVGFLGCCGAMCESVMLLTLFFIIVLILTTIEVGAVIFAITSKEQFKNVLHRLLSEAGKAENKYLQNLKPIEDLFHCCGATQETMGRYMEYGLCDGELHNKPDCFTAISDYLESTGEVVVIIAFFLLIIELFALTSTCILCKAFHYERPYYYA
uniref:Tetraspanin n=1 Tax=Elaeophora elaphi TaxID=1147741 RepID=A0A0R3RQT6_9BILA